MGNVENDSFFSNYYIKDATLYVPESLLVTYQTRTPWNRFGTILPLTDEVELGLGTLQSLPSPSVLIMAAWCCLVLLTAPQCHIIVSTVVCLAEPLQIMALPRSLSSPTAS